MGTSLRRFLTLGILALVALVLSHQVIFLAQDGTGTQSAAAAARDGDSYWRSVELIVAAVAVGLVATGLHQLIRLRRQARRVRRGAVIVPESGVLHLVRLFLPVWARVTFLSGFFLLAQENLEYLAVGAPLPGLGALAPAEFEFAWLVIVTVAAAVALVASLVRWRTLVLTARLRAAASIRPRATSVRSVPRPVDWRAVAPLLATGLGRRAPPVMSAA